MGDAAKIAATMIIADRKILEAMIFALLFHV